MQTEHIIYWIGGILFSLAGLVVPFIFKEVWNRIKTLEKDNSERTLSLALIHQELKQIKDNIAELKQAVDDLPCYDVCKVIERGRSNGKEKG